MEIYACLINKTTGFHQPSVELNYLHQWIYHGAGSSNGAFMMFHGRHGFFTQMSGFSATSHPQKAVRTGHPLVNGDPQIIKMGINFQWENRVRDFSTFREVVLYHIQLAIGSR